MLAAFFTALATQQTVPLNSAALYFSQHNWARTPTSATAVNAGAYLKVSWSPDLHLRHELTELRV